MDVIAILERLSSIGAVRLNKVSGNYYSVYCPFHKDGQEKRPSCGVLINEEYRNGQTYPEGFWHCFTCGAAKTMNEAVEELISMKKISSKDDIDWLKSNLTDLISSSDFDYLLPRNVVKTLNNKFAIDYIREYQSSSKLHYVSDDELSNYRYTVDYMYERKLTDDVISKFDVGVDLHFIPSGRVKEVPCITFPVRDKSGNVLFICRRSIKGKNFYMPQGVEKPVYGLYELPASTESVIICESVFNALTCYVYGYPAVALFGTGTSKQIEALKLLGVSEYVLGLDPDDAGDRGCNKLRKALKQVAIVRRMDIPSGKDLNDLDKESFIDSYRNRI